MGRSNKSSLVKTNSGHFVKSFSEAKVDDWFHANGYRTIYEPVIEINGREFVPDWLILPNDSTVLRPILVEYWGLLREGRVADWVIQRREKYQQRKEIKEEIYESSGSYDFIGIMPCDIESSSSMDQFMHEQMVLLRRQAAFRQVVCEPVFKSIAD